MMCKFSAKQKKYIFAFIIFILVITRFCFSMGFKSFFVKTMKLDDELMVNQMMTLSQRNTFRGILSKDFD